MMRKAMRSGFTLVELLVVLILLGLLTAIVFPVVVQQIDDAEPTKIANDLANIKTGVEVFHLNVRPRWAGDLEDLVHQIDAANDEDIQGSLITTVNKWKGPYIDAVIPEGTVAAQQESGNAILTGYGLQIQNEIVCYNVTANTYQAANGAITCVEGTDFVAILIGGADVDDVAPYGAEFTAVDNLVDNGDGPASGKIRAAEIGGAVLDATPGTELIVYLAAPYTD